MGYQYSEQGMAITKDCALLPSRKTNEGDSYILYRHKICLGRCEGLPRCMISAVSGLYAISGQ